MFILASSSYRVYTSCRSCCSCCCCCCFCCCYCYACCCQAIAFDNLFVRCAPEMSNQDYAILAKIDLILGAL